MGSDVVARNVGWFGGRWHAGHTTLSRNLGGCQEYVAQALESYQATDGELRAALLLPAVGLGTSTPPAAPAPERLP
jgi:hypothetical protein